jgi:mannose-6-phosphate isomerase-like protein (cupin superfamily)
MKSKFIAPLLFAALLKTAFAAEEPAKTGVVHIDQEKVAAAFAKGGPILVTNDFKVQTGRRTGPGEVELHDRDTDIFYILEGSAVFITGGKVVAPKLIGPGETRAKEIIGGEENRLTKGDVIIIPRGVPHWFKEVHGTFVYYVVKVTK